MRSAFSTSSLYHSEKFSCLRPMGSPRMGRGCGSLYKKAGSRVARDAPRPAGPENAMSAKSAKVAKSPFVASLALFALIAFFGPLTREISLDALPSEGQPSRVPEHLVIRAGAALAHGPAPLDDLQRAQVVEAVLAERLVRQLHLRHEGAVGAEVAVAPQGLARGGDGVHGLGTSRTTASTSRSWTPLVISPSLTSTRGARPLSSRLRRAQSMKSGRIS